METALIELAAKKGGQGIPVGWILFGAVLVGIGALAVKLLNKGSGNR